MKRSKNWPTMTMIDIRRIQDNKIHIYFDITLHIHVVITQSCEPSNICRVFLLLYILKRALLCYNYSELWTLQDMQYMPVSPHHPANRILMLQCAGHVNVRGKQFTICWQIGRGVWLQGWVYHPNSTVQL